MFGGLGRVVAFGLRLDTLVNLRPYLELAALGYRDQVLVLASCLPATGCCHIVGYEQEQTYKH